MDGTIFHLKEQLLESPQHNWTIEEMSQIVELSVPHFQKLFRAEMTIAPMMEDRKVRVEVFAVYGDIHTVKSCSEIVVLARFLVLKY